MRVPHRLARRVAPAGLASAITLAGAVIVLGFGAGTAVASSRWWTPTDTVPTGTTTTPTVSTPTVTTPTPLDAASDHAALIHYRAYLRALIAGEQLGRQSAIEFASQVKLRCSGVLATVAALPSAQVDQVALSDLGEEIGGDLTLVFLSEATVPFAQLSSDLGGLSWSEPAPALAVNNLLAAERTMLSLSPTQLCADARAVANRPLSVPARTLTFLGAYLRAATLLRQRLTSFLSVLSSYSTPADQRLIAGIDRLVAQFSATSVSVDKAGATMILSVLGLVAQ